MIARLCCLRINLRGENEKKKEFFLLLLIFFVGVCHSADLKAFTCKSFKYPTEKKEIKNFECKLKKIFLQKRKNKV